MTTVFTPGIPRVLVHDPSSTTLYGDIATFAERAPGVIYLPKDMELPSESETANLHREIGQLPLKVTEKLTGRYGQIPDVIKGLLRNKRVASSEATDLLALLGFETVFAAQFLRTTIRNLKGHMEASRHMAPDPSYKVPYQLGRYSLRSIIEYSGDKRFPDHPAYGFGKVLAGLDGSDREIMGAATAYTIDTIYPR
jgi:hypothetical protein